LAHLMNDRFKTWLSVPPAVGTLARSDIAIQSAPLAHKRLQNCTVRYSLVQVEKCVTSYGIRTYDEWHEDTGDENSRFVTRLRVGSCPVGATIASRNTSRFYKSVANKSFDVIADVTISVWCSLTWSICRVLARRMHVWGDGRNGCAARKLRASYDWGRAWSQTSRPRHPTPASRTAHALDVMLTMVCVKE
jgi:hypothetical protein